MSQTFFDPPLFIREQDGTPVDTQTTPYVCNIKGRPQFTAQIPTGIVELQPVPGRPLSDDPALSLGHGYQVSSTQTTIPDPLYGEQTKMEFVATEVVYEPLPATREVAAAFGITLIEPGQGLRMQSPIRVLDDTPFEYGMFAGHQCPYLPKAERFQLQPTVCTDLEHHDFPHVFSSVDPQLPLVISVGRYWPQRAKIFLADLWVPQGMALYIPPRPKKPDAAHIDLHGNRNSALACWRGGTQKSVQTRTLLPKDGGYFYWFWNALPTVHPMLT
ncbi:MAG: hypothetical protein LBI76_09310 [Comamonas sp.]|nr:hypothetical protein [Comamonas sp.]